MRSPNTVVLVVDDDPRIRGLLARMLAAYAVKCELASSTDDAIRQLDTGLVDIAFLDVNLDGVSGLELARTMQARYRDVATVMVTGLQNVATAQDALRAGVVDFVLKPFDEAAIASALQRAQRALAVRKQATRAGELERESRQTRQSASELATELALTLSGSVDAIVTALGHRSPELTQHGRRVADLAVRLGRWFELDDEDLVVLERAGLVHEVGRLTVPDTTGAIPAADAFSRAREILGCIPGLAPVAEVVGTLAERFDGGGPAGLHGDQISIHARIVAAADACDALAQSGEATDAGAVLLAEAGRAFDPAIVAVLAHVAAVRNPVEPGAGRPAEPAVATLDGAA